MTNELIAKIKAEIERLMDEYKPIVGGVDETTGAHIVLAKLLSFLSTLEESERPEPYNPVYDEAYLNEKIKKATESWRGVDVDAMLAECRGYDEEKSEKPMQEGLEEEIERVVTEYSERIQGGKVMKPSGVEKIARYFAQWGAENLKK